MRRSARPMGKAEHWLPSDGDGVVTFDDENGGDPRGRTGRDEKVLHVDALLLQSKAERSAESVVAHAAHHADGGAETGRSDRLVRPLASGGGDDGTRGERLSEDGQAGRLHDQIHVDRTDAHDTGHGTHFLRALCRNKAAAEKNAGV